MAQDSVGRWRGLGAPATLLVVGLVGSLASWWAQLLGIRAVGPVNAAGFIAGWSLYFAVVGSFSGLQQEATRTSTVGNAETGPRLGTASIATGLVGGALGLAVVLRVAPAVGAGLAFLIVVGWIASASQSGVIGGSVARHAIGIASAAMLSDALLRLGLFACAYWLGESSAQVFLGLASAASLVATGLILGVGGLGFLRVRMGPSAAAVRRVAQASGAALLSALLITGAPMLVSALGAMNGFEEARVLALLSLTRAPVLLPIVALQSWLLNQFALTSRLRSSLLRAFGAIALVAVSAAGAAALAGDLLVSTMLGGAYSLPTAELSVLVASSAFIGFLVVVSLAAIGTDRHRLSVGAWAATLVLTVAALPLMATGVLGVAAALALPPLVVSLAGAKLLTTRPNAA